MKFTNKQNLPEPIARAVTRFEQRYSKGGARFSVTELLKPPRARVLIEENQDRIEEDVADRIWALMGQIGHAILADDGEGTHRRFFGRVAGQTVSGEADLILSTFGHYSELVDYKFCSVWTSRQGAKPEWTQQCNMLRYLAHGDATCPAQILKAKIVAIYRDWSKPKASREQDYPQSQVEVFPIELWPSEQTHDFIVERIGLHLAAEQELPLCTDEERWKDPPKWALMKRGSKRAIKLFEEERQAEAAAGHGYYVEERRGEPKRCLHYCLAAPFCSQFREEMMDQPI